MERPVPLHQRLIERFLLGAATRTAIATSERARAALAPRLKRARGIAEAADALFCDGYRVESLRMMSKALDETLVLADEDAHGELLAARGVRLGPIRALARDLRGAEPPAGTDALYLRALSARRRLDEALTLAASTEAQLLRSRRARLAGAALLVLAAALLPIVPWPELPEVRVRASGQWAFNAHFPGDAVDGDPDTEWQTPNQQPGWLDLRISPPVDITQVRLLNGHNQRFGDRGCAMAIVSVYSGGELLVRHEARWSGIADPAEWVVLPVDGTGVDLIHIEILSHHGVGAALAEVDWE